MKGLAIPRVIAVAACAIALGCAGQRTEQRAAVREASAVTPPAGAEAVTIVEFTEEGQRLEPSVQAKLVLPEEEWRARLSPLAFAVARRKDTELAFTGRYNKHHEAGMYRCVACGTALFSSEAKFDSGTGWPSFTAPAAAENVYTMVDLSLGVAREEVLCRRCDGHLGHVFPDGPPPGGMRYCINSAALRFVGFAGVER